jgi:hypothetical protein
MIQIHAFALSTDTLSMFTIFVKRAPNSVTLVLALQEINVITAQQVTI